MCSCHRTLQSALNLVLNCLVNRQDNGLSLLRSNFKTLVRLTSSVPLNKKLSRLTTDLGVVRLLNTSKSLPLEANEAKNVSSKRTIWVITFRFQQGLQPW